MSTILSVLSIYLSTYLCIYLCIYICIYLCIYLYVDRRLSEAADSVTRLARRDMYLAPEALGEVLEMMDMYSHSKRELFK